MYKKDAIKEIAPNQTVQQCTEIFDKYNFKSITDSLLIFEERFEMFGMYTGTFSLNPYGLYEMFPEQFPYMKGKEHVNFQKSNGKGLSFYQCQASLYVEMLERLSIMLFEQMTDDFDEDKRKLFEAEEYYSYIKENANYLYDHFMSKKFGYKLHPEKAEYLSVENIKDGSKVFFPSYVIFDTMGTNGFTAGNTKEEAITGGIFEIVERYTQTVFCLDEIEAKKINLDSIVELLPELKENIQKCREYFDKYDVVDVSVTINGVKFYSYFVRTEFDATGHKTFSAGGCHIDQRIALIRALSEGIQSFNEKIEDANKTTTRRQGWGINRLFSKYFIKRVYEKIDKLSEITFKYENADYKSIHEIYDKSLKAFENILILDCTNEHFKVPSLIIYIPELFPKTYIWPSLFHVGTEMHRGSLVAQNIEGIEKMYFWNDELLSVSDEQERNRMYLNTISKIKHKEIITYVKSLYPEIEIPTLNDEVESITPYDNSDPESFIFLNNKIEENDDFNFLFESYARIGCLALSKTFIKKVSDKNLISKYIDKYISFGEYLIENDEYERALLVYKQLVEISEEDVYVEEFEKIKTITDSAIKIKESIFDKETNKIFNLSVEDSFENYILKDIVEEGMFNFELQFENDGDNFNLSVFTIEPDDYHTEINNAIYIDHLHGLLNRKERKFLKKFIKHVKVFDMN